MADKVVLTSVDIDVDKALQDTQKLREEVSRLKEQTDNLKKTQGDTSQAYIQSNAQLRAAQGELRTQENLVTKVATANKAQTGSLQQMKAELAVVTSRWNSLSKEERLNTDAGQKLTKRKTELTAALKKEEMATGDARRNVGNYGNTLNQATGALGQFVPGLAGASKAVSSFGIVLNLALLPITAIVVAIIALISYFKRSEEGQDSLAKVTKVFMAVLDNLLDVVAELGKVLFDAVSKPKEAWQKFKDFVAQIGEFFKATFGNVIGGSIQIFVGTLETGFAKVGLAWQKLKNIFVDNSDKIEKANQKVKEAQDKVADGQDRIKQGVDTFKDTVKEGFDKAKKALQGFIAEQEREIAIAKRLADEEAAIRKRERMFTVENAKLTKQAAEIRAEAERQKFIDAQKSIDLYNESFDLDEKILANELEIARRKAANARETAALSKSTIEVLDEVAQKEAEVEQKQAAFNEKRRERTRRLNMIRREALKQETDRLKTELQLATITADQRIRLNERVLDDELSSYDEREKALKENAELRNEILQAQADIELREIQANLDLQLLSEEDAAQQRLLVRERLADESLKILEETIEAERDIREADTDDKLDKLIAENENYQEAYRDNLLAVLDLERESLELKYQQEVEAAERIGMDTTSIEAKYSAAKKEIARAERDAKLSLAQGFAANLAQILGEQTAVGKAAAIAATTIETFKSATASYSALAPIPIVGPVLGFAAAAAAIAAGLANVKKILAVKSGLPGDKAGGGGASASAAGAGGGGAARPVSVNPQIGQGIVSRATAGAGTKAEELTVQPTLVVDDVTAGQSKEVSQNQTSAI